MYKGRFVFLCETKNGTKILARYNDKHEAITAIENALESYSDMRPRLVDVIDCKEYIGYGRWLEEKNTAIL